MSVSAIDSISGTSSVTDAYTQLQRAQQKLATDLAAKADARKVVAGDRDAVTRAQQASQQATRQTTQQTQDAQAEQTVQTAQAAQRTADQQALPVAQTPQQQSQAITASGSALGGSFDVTV
jgi:hypothetical protein